MDRDLALPALVLLDEVGAGTDPVEGGALGTAVIDHFRQRGAHLVATTHYDSLKSYASTTEGVVSAAFGFNPETFAPTYRLIYGSPGRSLAIEIAARLGMPPSVIAAARENLTDREKQLAEHLARVDRDLRALEQERRSRRARARSGRRGGEGAAGARGSRCASARKRCAAALERQGGRPAARGAPRDRRRHRRAEGAGGRAARAGGVRLRSGDKVRAAGISTGETGAARADARAALDAVVDTAEDGTASRSGTPPVPHGANRRRSSPACAWRSARSASKARSSSCTASTPRSTCAASGCAPRCATCA